MAGGWIVVLLVIVLGVIGGIAGSSGSTSAEPLSQEVLAYTSTIQRYASQYGISEYVPSIQAIMMQESGGRGTDPMRQVNVRTIPAIQIVQGRFKIQSIPYR